MNRYLNYIMLIFMIIIAAFGAYSVDETHSQNYFEYNSLYQVSTYPILAAGNYVGNVTVGELKSHGDTGIGTFNYFDGEMVERNGVVYQIKTSGKIDRVSDDQKVPYALVTRFKPSNFTKINSVNYSAFQSKIGSYFTGKKSFFVIKAQATFDYIKVRSVPRQTELNNPIAEIINNQTVFYGNNVTGTLIGFWCPSNYGSIDPVGFHLHFISFDEKIGGHVLDFTLNKGNVEYAEIKNVILVSKDNK